MTLHDSDVRQMTLKPGEIFVGVAPARISTILGSCVAVTLFAPRSRIGAICHALLPACRTGADCPERFRHVECAIGTMLSVFLDRGIPYGGIEAKLFGGADMFSGDGRAFVRSSETVGRQNVVMAELLLGEAGIRVTAADVGGLVGRKIVFFSHTGDVFLKRLARGSSLGNKMT